MAFSVVGTAVYTHEGFSANRLSVAVPSGLATNDILFAGWPTANNHTINTLPSGWTQVGTTQDAASDSSLSVARRVVDGTEGSTIDFNSLFNGAESGGSVTWAIRGADPDDVIDSVGQTNTNGTGLSGPSVTPTVNNSLIMQIFGSDPGASAVTFTADASPVATKVWDGKADDDDAGYLGVQIYEQSTAAAIALDATMSVSDNYAHFQIVLNPESGAPPTGIPIFRRRIEG